MASEGPLSQYVLWVGQIPIEQSILTSWSVLLVLFIFFKIINRQLRAENPTGPQVLLEAIYITMHNAIEEVLPDHTDMVFPYVASLWIFILILNLIGVIPGLSAPTTDLSVTASLAVLTLFSVHWFGIRTEGIKNYLKHYIKPSPILLPFHIISEITRTLALAVRLFGNIMSLELTALIVLMVAGLLIPVPILMLHIIEAIIQAYIFGMLALIYIAGGIHTQILRREKENLNG